VVVARAGDSLPDAFASTALGSRALRNYSRNAGVFPVKIVRWRTEIAVERCDNFAHLRYTSSSRGTDVSYRAALQVVAVRGAVRESSGGRVL